MRFSELFDTHARPTVISRRNARNQIIKEPPLLSKRLSANDNRAGRQPRRDDGSMELTRVRVNTFIRGIDYG
jgi:hypothetical protein